MTTMWSEDWKWENAAAGAVAGFATVAALHPLDVVRTRFQVSDGRPSILPQYKNTGHAIYTIARSEGLRGLYAGFSPAVLGSTVSWGLYFFFYSRAKQRYHKGDNDKLSPGHHLASAAEAGALVCLITNPIWLVKTRLQLQTPKHHSRPYAGFSDALRTILKEEGLSALYRGIGPGLLLVTHGAIQFTAYEELRSTFIYIKSREVRTKNTGGEELLNSFDYATLGAASKLAAILLTYPYQVIRTRLQQRPSSKGTPKYLDSWHVVKETAKFEGVRGFYKGITSNLLKNLPAASITFVVYENVLKIFRVAKGQS
ncbi:folate transporter 1, chloroplastic isoform X1 [Ananas comosus]|uniref:Folate transporter 1, chloroplastic isoform X1 n=2 Tax=Ananas comosus TaxID=4615 RepID=A0A6P5GH26_ANACO|nr:folate transporter 1, chloroplastic isoform X1 [Ananas comosus]